MKLMKKIFMVTICLLLILSGLAYIDYFLVKTQNTVPKISFKEEKQDFTIYNALFYRVWYCKDSKTSIIGGYSDPDAVCPKIYEYNDGYYTNSSGIKISQRDLELITKDGIYTSEMVENMKSDSDVNDAIYVAYSYGRTIYKKLSNNLIIFPDFYKKNDKYDWYYNEEDTANYYCIVEKGNDITYSKYINNECDINYVELELDEEWCGKYKNSTLVYKDDVIKKYCKE